MKEELLGLNHLLSLAAVCQTVMPPSPALSSGHLRSEPPHSSNLSPRYFSYHAASAFWSPVLLKKTPPIPVTLAMVASRLCDAVASCQTEGCGARQRASRQDEPAR